ncbi:MAG: cytidine deaminase [Patescibacteria group bacterium]|jgi:cytidine deaminase
MTTKLTLAEKKLINHAKKAAVKYNKTRKSKGGIDTLYSFLLSDSGKIYDGACLESNVGHANICGERHAIANLIMNESYKAKIKSIVVADPVPKAQKHGTMPCGTCRHLIWQFGSPKTTVLCLQYIKKENGWIFLPKIEKYTIKKIYPNAYEPVKWD